MARFKGFVRVASSFSLMDVRLAVAALDGADILTLSAGTELGNMVPHYSLALGPMEVYVPEADAAEALELLNGVAAGLVFTEDGGEPLDCKPLTVTTTFGDTVRNILGFFIGGVSRPLKGLMIHQRPDPGARR